MILIYTSFFIRLGLFFLDILGFISTIFIKYFRTKFLIFGHSPKY